MNDNLILTQFTKHTTTMHKIIYFNLCIIVSLSFFAGCGIRQGSVAVILDNSSSMASTGTSFKKIKESLVNTLMLVPNSYDIGLRVFDLNGSRLLSPYQHDLKPLRNTLTDIEPIGGTYIGPSLLDAVNDLREKPNGDNRLIMITDGEGSESDIEAAKEVKRRLADLEGGFKCSFILFSTRKDVINETPIGKVSEILGCNLNVAGDYATAHALTPALQKILGFDFYWLWIIVSLLLYTLLLYLVTTFVFAIQIDQGVLPRYARGAAILFLFSLFPIALGAHLIGLFSWLSSFVWWLVILSIAVILIAASGIGKKINQKTKEVNPFE
jgi:hypothetical protein